MSADLTKKQKKEAKKAEKQAKLASTAGTPVSTPVAATENKIKKPTQRTGPRLKFAINPDHVEPVPDSSADVRDKLPARVYAPLMTQRGLMLRNVEAFDLPSKVYGDMASNAERFLKTYEKRETTMGILLCGEKGSGKSLLAKLTAAMAIEKGMPVLLISTPMVEAEFFQFLQGLEQRLVIIFDEFEKVYDEDAQASILTLLDGVYSTHHLFIFTANDKWKLNVNMRNRPGRIYYALEFEGMHTSFIEGYVDDNLLNKEHKRALMSVPLMFGNFNFDMLKALVEEMNLWNETPREALRLLNAKPQYEASESFLVEIRHKGLRLPSYSEINDAMRRGGRGKRKKITCPLSVDTQEWRGVPLLQTLRVNTYVPDEGDETQWRNEETLEFTPEDANRIDASTGCYVFASGDFEAHLKRKPRVYGAAHELELID